MIRRNLIYILIIISVILFVLDYFRIISPVREPFEDISLGLKKRVYMAGLTFKNFFSVVFQYSDIEKIIIDKNKFQSKSKELELKKILLEEENYQLRKQLEAPLPSSYKFIPANVVGVTRYMEISLGERDKVEKGMVVVDGNIYIGKIIKTKAKSSLVSLPDDLDNHIPAKTTRGTQGSVVGHPVDGVLFEKVLQKDDLFLNDLVYTNGGDGYPPDLLIGEVTYIDADDVKVYKKARIKPALDYKKEHTVFVIIVK